MFHKTIVYQGDAGQSPKSYGARSVSHALGHCGLATRRSIVEVGETGAIMKAHDVMSSPVITVRPDTLIPAAAQLLVSHGYTAAPVMEDGRVIGIVTEANLMRDQIRPEGWPHPATWDKPSPQTVRDVMTPAPRSGYHQMPTSPMWCR
jgi:CBS-domain-containing membrane protein